MPLTTSDPVLQGVVPDCDQILAPQETCSVRISGCGPRNLPLKQAPATTRRRLILPNHWPALYVLCVPSSHSASLDLCWVNGSGEVTAQRKETQGSSSCGPRLRIRHRRLPQRSGLLYVLYIAHNQNSRLKTKQTNKTTTTWGQFSET